MPTGPAPHLAASGALPRPAEPVLGAVFDLASEAMLLADDRRRLVAANPAACVLLGRAEDELRALRLDDVVPGTRRRALPALWRSLLAESEHRGELQVALPDATRRDVGLRAVARVALGRHLLVLEDRSDRDRDGAVRAAMLDAALDAVITTDASGAVLDWNPAAERIFGYASEDAMGRPMAELIIPERLREQHRAGVERSVAGNGARSRRMEPPAQRADGTEFPTELTIARTEGPDPLFIGVVRDLTDQRRMTAALAESEERFRRLAEQATDVIYLVALEPELRFDYVNPAVSRMLGVDPEELRADVRSALRLIHPEDRHLLADVDAWTEAPRIVRWRRRDGEVVWGEHRSVAVRDAAGRVVAVQGIARDITAQRLAEAEQSRLAQIVESSQDAILAKSPDAVITTWNAGAERLYGWTAAEAIGRHISLIVPADKRLEDERVLSAVIAGTSVPPYESQRMAKGGVLLDVSLTQSPVLDDAGRVVGASVIARDLTERKRLERQLHRYAELDMLTGLLNRPRFEAELKRALATTPDGDAPGAVIVLDIDHFKLVNDAHGHAGGDDVLCKIAQAVARRCRETDILARIGVDEFAVLLPGVREQGARAVAYALTTAVSECATDLPLTASAGVAVLGAQGCEASEEVMVAAGLALGAAKQGGGGGVEVFSGHRNPDLVWAQRLRRALADDGLVLHGQPILDLRTDEVTQHELLVRMVGDDGELVLPGEFLPTAERLGIVRDLDRWVVDRALAVAAQGRTVEVNLSARSLDDAQLTAWLEARVRESGVDARRLIFEITETAAIEKLDEARALVERLTALGCGVALDDFGTGFGSFRYLKHLPVTHLKIDMEFVRGLAGSEADQRIVRAIASIARGQGMKTVAEGVEDAASLALLREYGVDSAQGYFVGRPGPLEP